MSTSYLITKIENIKEYIESDNYEEIEKIFIENLSDAKFLLSYPILEKFKQSVLFCINDVKNQEFVIKYLELFKKYNCDFNYKDSLGQNLAF